MKILGRLYKEGSAAWSDAALTTHGEEAHVFVDEQSVLRDKLVHLIVSDRLGNVERKVIFTDGSVFATSDNDGIDRLFAGHRKKLSGLLHRLESNIRSVVIALLVTTLCFFTFVKWGIPWTSSKIAHALPFSVNELIAQNSLEFLDEYIFEESKLEKNKTDQIRAHFQKIIKPIEAEHADIVFNLYFRDWQTGEQGIPNAFALPSGDIILTDKFIELCSSQDEINSVLLHEVGHVLHRHTLERIIEATFVATVVMMITGDNNGFADIGLGLGSLLLSSNYSRDHESEADVYAFEQMLAARVDPKVFSDILSRMSTYMEEAKEQSTKQDWVDYISSHPSTQDRVEQALHYSECFKKGKLHCPPNS